MKTKYTIHYKLLLIVIITIINGFLTDANAQTFEEAQNLIKQGENNKAKTICLEILSKDYNTDAALLLGRIYAWDKMYDSSRVVINEVMTKYPQNLEALDVMSDVEFWSGNHDQAVQYCNKALEIDVNNTNFQLKKARILDDGNKTEEAVEVLENLLKQDNHNPEAIQNLREYRLKLMKNEIKLQYTLDYFNEDFNRDPWNMVTLQYSRKTKFGSVIPRINLADKYGTNGLQAELDIWPKVNKNNYGYINYGFSTSSIFPENRVGLEWYHNFPNSFEGSLGVRFLDFGTETTDIYTASFGKYFGNNWASFRSYLTPDSTGVSFSGAVQLRHYFNDPAKYLNLKLGYGVSPDDNRNLVNSDLNSRLNLNTATLRIEYNHIINKMWILNIGSAVNNEEFKQDEYSNYFTFDLSVARLF
jgi:YaiO family outer membrane protein